MTNNPETCECQLWAGMHRRETLNLPPLHHPRCQHAPRASCELCEGTGFHGDQGPGIEGNAEWHRCECQEDSGRKRRLNDDQVLDMP